MNLKKSTFSEYLAIEPILSADSRMAVLTIPKPRTVAGRDLPGDLNNLNLGALLMLQQAKSDKVLHEIVAREVVGLDVEEFYRAPAYDAIGLINWVANQLERINNLFAGAGRTPTAQEERAGYHALNLGAFGIIDWFAQRMKITHEAATATPWITVYKCMEADGKLEDYRRRLEKIMVDEAKLKAKNR